MVRGTLFGVLSPRQPGRSFPQFLERTMLLLNLRRAGVACLVLFVLCLGVRDLAAQTVARCGDGWLEMIDGYPVLHLKGSHYEMGYQQGALLKDDIRQNMHALLVERGEQTLKVGMLNVKPRTLIDSITAIQK